MLLKIKILAGPEAGRILDLTPNKPLIIGRGALSDTEINDPKMSRVHCRIEYRGNETFLVDEHSRSGTLIEGESIAERKLSVGDVFEAGSSRFQLSYDTDAEGSTFDSKLASEAQHSSIDLTKLVGEQFDDYRMDEVIATGHSGLVFRGVEVSTNLLCAIKVLQPDSHRSEEQKERFVRAMKTMLPIRHPKIVRLYNAGKRGPYLWAAMQFVMGESMAEVIRKLGVQRMLDWRSTWKVAFDITEALCEAYQQKIIHRNVTPRNILRRGTDQVSILSDLMLAKSLDGVLAQDVTKAGNVVGDMPYMPPERLALNATIDCRSDLYGLGATLYALLTGHPPARGSSMSELVQSVRNEVPKSPKQFQYSTNDMFADLVMKLIEKDPDDRYQTPHTLMKDLDSIGRYGGVEA